MLSRRFAVAESAIAILMVAVFFSWVPDQNSNAERNVADVVVPVVEHDHHHGHYHDHGHSHDHADYHHHGDGIFHSHDHHSTSPFAATMLVSYNGNVETREIDMNEFERNGVRYRWEHCPQKGKIPAECAETAKATLHNNADRDPISGEVITVVAQYGLIVFDPTLNEGKFLEGQDHYFAKGMNSHGTDCFIHKDDRSLWAFASTNTREVVIARRGEILAKLGSPKGTEFDNATVNEYFKGNGAFNPCDVVYSPGSETLTVVIGYTPGDFALTAKEIDGVWQWSGAAWGGKIGTGDGIYSTAHGVQTGAPIDGEGEVLAIASRGHGRVYGHKTDGKHVNLPGVAEGKNYIQLPAGSNPCNIFVNSGDLFMPFLNPIAGTEGKAPVFITRDGQQVGSIVPGTYEGLELMVHMHGACIVEIDGELYCLALSWRNGGENNAGKHNDGAMAVFKAVRVGRKA